MGNVSPKATTTRILMQISRNMPFITPDLIPQSQWIHSSIWASSLNAFQRKTKLQTPPILVHPHHACSLLKVLFLWVDFHSGHPSLCLYSLSIHLLKPSKAFASHFPLGFHWHPQAAAPPLGGYPVMQWIHYAIVEKTQYHVVRALNMLFLFCNTTFQVQSICVFSQRKVTHLSESK